MKIDQIGQAVRLRDKLKSLQVDLEHVKAGRMSVRHSHGERLDLFQEDEMDQAFNRAIQALMEQKVQHQIDLAVAALKGFGVTV